MPYDEQTANASSSVFPDAPGTLVCCELPSSHPCDSAEKAAPSLTAVDESKFDSFCPVVLYEPKEYITISFHPAKTYEKVINMFVDAVQ